jgi:hypothetical protein
MGESAAPRKERLWGRLHKGYKDRRPSTLWVWLYPESRQYEQEPGIFIRSPVNCTSSRNLRKISPSEKQNLFHPTMFAASDEMGPSPLPPAQGEINRSRKITAGVNKVESNAD